MPLQLVNVGTKLLADYASIATRGLMAQIKELAGPLESKRVLHLSATAFGGGVAEILYTLVPLMRDAGLDVEWRIIQGQDEFFDVTKTIHNALQGDPTGLTSEQQEIFEAYQLLNAEALEGTYDFVIVHDPQPVGVIEHARHVGRHRTWRCHIDLSEPNRSVLEFVLPWICAHDAAIFHRRQYVPDAKPADGVDLAAGDRPAGAEEHGALGRGCGLHRRSVRHRRPSPARHAGQPFRPWKDPLGVIEAWRIVRQSQPELQLALVGSMAHDDPEGWEYYNRTVAAADGDPDIFILSNLNNVGSVEVNAFSPLGRRSAEVDPEGFGLTVTEALWKSRPVVAGRVGGIVDQLQDGVTGYLVSSVEECAEKTRLVLDTPAQSRELALRGKEHVRRHFPHPRLLRLARALQRAGGGTAVTWRSWLSPCGPPSRAVSLYGVRRMADRRKLIVVSNRGPVVYDRGESGGAVARRGGGGLVTALRSLVEHHEVTWIASTMSDEDRSVAEEAHDEPIEEVARGGAAYRLRLVAHDPSAYDWHYNVIANPMLWFIQHYPLGLATRRTSTTASTMRAERGLCRRQPWLR